MKRISIYLCSILAGILLVGVYVRVVAAATNIQLTTEITKDNRMVIYANATPPVYIRGYDMQFDFDPKQVEIQEVSYHVGTVSEGLGDASDTIDRVNSKGKIVIRGESTEKDGDVINEKKQPLVSVVFKGKNETLKLVKGTSVFYVIGNGGILSKSQAESEMFSVSQTDKNSSPIPVSQNSICREFWGYVMSSSPNPFIMLSRMMSWVSNCKK